MTLDDFQAWRWSANRRAFLQSTSWSMGQLALAQLFLNERRAQGELSPARIAPQAKQIIFLFQAGGPAQ